MKTFTLSIAVMFVVAASVNATVVVITTGTPTKDLEGFTTWMVSAASDSGPISGIDVTFSEAMNQVNPFGAATIWQDTNGLITGTGADISQNSQFLFMSADVFPLAAEMAEGAFLLKGAFTNISAHTGGEMSVDFAQIVIADGSCPFCSMP